MAAEPLKITVKSAATSGKEMERFAKLRTFSSFILTGIARIWFLALLLCHINTKLFFMKDLG